MRRIFDKNLAIALIENLLRIIDKLCSKCLKKNFPKKPIGNKATYIGIIL
jgi:hypothetical protein